jgi:hypothetical protein
MANNITGMKRRFYEVSVNGRRLARFDRRDDAVLFITMNIGADVWWSDASNVTTGSVVWSIDDVVRAKL